MPTPERVAVLESTTAAIQTATEARQAIWDAEMGYRRFHSLIEDEASLEEAFSSLNVPDRRRAYNDQLAALESARMSVRQAVIALGVSEGESLGKMARLWGVSRQLVTRMAKQNTQEDGACPETCEEL
jgi:hypothetical protein